MTSSRLFSLMRSSPKIDERSCGLAWPKIAAGREGAYFDAAGAEPAAAEFAAPLPAGAEPWGGVRPGLPGARGGTDLVAVATWVAWGVTER